MKQIRSVQLLPEIFQTDTNKRFLAATLDQLVQEPELQKIQGFVGRKKIAKPGEYISEPELAREQYQLEPAVVVSDENGDAIRAVTYPEVLDALQNMGATVTNHRRLFDSEFYSFAPLVDLDKLVNFSQYYWLPNGPDSVNVAASEVPIQATFEFTRNSGFRVKGFAGDNPTVTVIRGGEYEFKFNTPGRRVYIQTQPGVDGVYSYANNISTQDVLGVENNGADDGTITFRVPMENAQDAFFSMPEVQSVDLVADMLFSQIQNRPVSEFLAQFGGIDGIAALDGLTLVFKPQTEGWYANSVFDGEYDNNGFDAAVEVPESDRYKVWRVTLITNPSGIPNNPLEPTSTPAASFIKLVPVRDIAPNTKFKILYGTTESNKFYHKTLAGVFQAVPHLTANLSKLYYQDADDPLFFGEIDLITAAGNQSINVEYDILGKATYISGNGVQFTNGLKIKFQGTTVPESYSGQTYYVEGVGTGIELIPVNETVTPEPYTKEISEPWDTAPYDELPYDASVLSPVVPDYITINRAAHDRNAWSRSNRWTHIEVINATFEYNKFTGVIDNNLRANRPIIEFVANLELFNHGTRFAGLIDVIDYTVTDALSNINGLAFTDLPELDGYQLQAGSKVVFARDSDSNVRNTVYQVTLAQVDTTVADQFVVVLEPVASIAEFDSVVCLRGDSTRGKTFYYSNAEWRQAQQKHGVNQAPLFALYDNEQIPLNDLSKYLSSSFVGSKLFGYAIGTGIPDPVLKFPLKYKAINNVGDIVFEPFLFTDTFSYVADGSSRVGTANQSLVRDYKSGQYKNGWVKSLVPSTVETVFYFDGGSAQYVLDVSVDAAPTAAIKVWVNNKLVTQSEFDAVVGSSTTQIQLKQQTNSADLIEIRVVTSQVSSVGQYKIPLSLDKNAFNSIPTAFTLGAMRTHFSTAVENIRAFSGDVFGLNNSRDLPAVAAHATSIVQHSAPAVLVPSLTAKTNIDIVTAIRSAAVEYEKYKHRILQLAVDEEYGASSPAEILDQIIETLASSKTSANAFYWTDMLPAKVPMREVSITVTPATSSIIDTTQIYGQQTASFLAVLVYKNGDLLLRNYDYTLAVDGPRIQLLTPITDGDVITVREYDATYGSGVPDTPTKLGLYPAYKPEKFVDNTYKIPQDAIRGHDGSITLAFGDIRDDVLLEFEKRVYNNLKTVESGVLRDSDVVPSGFRTTEYTAAEIAAIADPELISWVSWNRIDYSAQEFDLSNEFSWNYSQCVSKLPNHTLKAYWRDIYFELYGTDTPHLTPWALLGFGEKPRWWDNEYGPGPWTNTDMVLWDDLAAGIIRDPVNTHVDLRYARPGLQQVIPVDGQGRLLSPYRCVVKEYNQNTFRTPWQLVSGSPTSAAFRRSSQWPFVVQKILLLTKPARYLSLNFDKDNYRYNNSLGQWLLDNHKRIQLSEITVKNDVARHSYLNWLVDYARRFGIDAAATITDTFAATNVKLAYRLAGFSDKRYLKIFAEQTSPTSANTSLLLPDESYDIVRHKNAAFDTVRYSAVVIQRTELGFSVRGYDEMVPFFTAYPVVLNSNYRTVQVGATTVKYARDFEGQPQRIPYGSELSSVDAVVNFLIGYGKYLEEVGFKFTDVDNNVALNWQTMAQEFVQWSQQAWPAGAIINLNPAANALIFERPGAVVDALNESRVDHTIVNIDRKTVKVNDVYVSRIGHEFVLESAIDDIISSLVLSLVSFEHILLLDNKSVFGDVIYDLESGVRQQRVKLAGNKTANWSGLPTAPGFVINEDTVTEWSPNRRYAKGEIVRFKNQYWSASKPTIPTETFDTQVWQRSNYAITPRGLLPNIATKAEQARNFYNNREANLEQDIDLLSFGIIGFRPRKYLSDINLDDITQVEVYSDFIRAKGTLPSLEMFNSTNVESDLTGYKVYENWAVKAATYGANANRQYIEVALDEDRLRANPAIVSYIEPGMHSDADQSVLISRLYKSSAPIQTAQVFPTVASVDRAIGLPTAGFVNISDVDITVFDLSDLTELNNQLTRIVAGTKVWVAKVNRHNWDVYVAAAVPAFVVRVVDQLDSTSIVSFNRAHKLNVADIIVIRDFDAQIDRAYRVKKIVDESRVQLEISLARGQTEMIGQGVAFVMRSAVVDRISDIIDLPHAGHTRLGSKVWVRDIGNNKWGVVERTSPYSFENSLTLKYFPEDTGAPGVTVSSSAGYAASLAQNVQGNLMVVGAPGDNGAYVYAKIGAEFAETSWLNLFNFPDVNNLGHAAAVGDGAWVAVSSPDSASGRGYVAIYNQQPTSSVHGIQQVLVGDIGSALGYALAMSADSRWLFVGAPGSATVEVFTRVDVADAIFEDQTLQAATSQVGYEVDVNAATQLNVLVDNVLQTPLVDYTIDPVNKTINFALLVPAGSQIRVSKKTVITADGPVATALDSLFVDYSGPESVVVTVNSGVLRLGIDYTISATNVIEFADPPAAPAVIAVKSHFRRFKTISNSANGFGRSLACSSDGAELVIGAPYQTVSGRTNAGAVFVYSRNDRRNGLSIATIGDDYVGPLQTLTQLTAADGALFGTAVEICQAKCSIFVGAPGAQSSGAVERFVNFGRVYGIVRSTVDLPITWANSPVLINGVEVATGDTPEEFAANINDLPVPNVVAEFNTVSRQLVIRVRSLANAEPLNMLSILPLDGSSSLQTYGFMVCELVQTITQPEPNQFAEFGATIRVNPASNMLFVGAPGAHARLPQTFDRDQTTFDFATSRWSDQIINAGAVYSFDLLVNRDDSENPGKFVFGQQIVNNSVETACRYGSAIALSDNHQLVVSAPLLDVYRLGAQFVTRVDAVKQILSARNNDYPIFYQPDSALVENPTAYGYVQIKNAGRIFVATNDAAAAAWQTVSTQRNIVDISRINSVYLYNKTTQEVVADLDYIDPLQAKILGIARQNIDYIGTFDPAYYNNGPVGNVGRRWSEAEVGSIWWNTENCRYLDYFSTTGRSSAQRWSQLFPGSTIEVYEWVESAVPPAEYTAGEVYSVDQYTLEPTLNISGQFEERYYFWVKNAQTVATARGKTLSAANIARYIQLPKTSGVPYVAFVAADTVALFNVGEMLVADDIVLHVEFETIKTDNNVHVEYELIAENNPSSFMSARLYRKFVDSFCGVDSLGNAVPDRTLSPAEMYGVSYRPRQSMFKDRFAALKNYITRVNSVLLQTPIRETKVFQLLNTYDLPPGSATGAWNKRMLSEIELQYQDLASDGNGFRYLVEHDSRNAGRWAIYEVVENASVAGPVFTLKLVQVQYYDTRQYWNYVNWYAPGYNSAMKPSAEVGYASELDRLSVPDRTLVRVRTNGTGHWELYDRVGDEWQRVAVEKGTIQIAEKIYDYSLGNYGFDLEVYDSTYFDQEPTTETRRVIEAINEELLVDDLAGERNAALMLMFNYILTEQIAPEWLTKTSLIDVEHTVRELQQDEYYKRDNQDFVLDFVNEGKPYHSKIREFSSKYSALETANGHYTDFDVPAYYDPLLQRFISPVVTTSGGISLHEHAIDHPIWTSMPWADWAQNYLLSVESVAVVSPGNGYTVRPILEVVGDAEVPAELVARLSSAGHIIGVEVRNPGSGYTSAPLINVVGGGGAGALLTPVMTPGSVRRQKTAIKFDRYEYQANVTQWQSAVQYTADDIVKKDHEYYVVGTPVVLAARGLEADYSVDAAEVFNIAAWSPTAEYAARELVTVAGKVYAATQPLAQMLVFRPEYFEEVQVARARLEHFGAADRTTEAYQPSLNMPGNELGLVIPGTRFGASWVYGKHWSPENPDELNTILQSAFDGVDPAATIDGDEFISVHHSHAPEELMPGIAFDTLDLRVYQRPGADYTGRGFAFEVKSATKQPVAGQIGFANLVQVPSFVRVIDLQSNQLLEEGADYSVNWHTQTVTDLPTDANLFKIVVYGIGGGNQLHRAFYSTTATEIVVPVSLGDISAVLTIVNGINVAPVSVEENDRYSTTVVFDGPAVSGVSVVVFGSSGFDYSMPQLQTLTASASETYTLSRPLLWANSINAFVEVNGRRLSPAHQVEYIAPSGTVYEFPPESTGYAGSIVESDVRVFVDDVEQQLLVDYVVDLSAQTVTLAAAPDARVVIAIDTVADYKITAQTQLWLKPQAGITAGDLITIVDFNDTRQLSALTKTFVGPAEEGYVNQHPYDSVEFDSDRFDLYEDLTRLVNVFYLGRPDADINRLWATLNGMPLRPEVDFRVVGNYIELLRPVISATDVLSVTALTNNVVPSGLEYRIFKDMNDSVKFYTMKNKTTLTAALDNDTATVQVLDANRLAAPASQPHRFGVVTIGAERITFKDKNNALGQLIGLRRGTAGTGVNQHQVGAEVIDISKMSEVAHPYDQSLYLNTSLPLTLQDTTFVQNLRD